MTPDCALTTGRSRRPRRYFRSRNECEFGSFRDRISTPADNALMASRAVGSKRLVAPAQRCSFDLAGDELFSARPDGWGKHVSAGPRWNDMRFATNPDDGVRIAYDLVGEGPPRRGAVRDRPWRSRIDTSPRRRRRAACASVPQPQHVMCQGSRVIRGRWLRRGSCPQLRSCEYPRLRSSDSALGQASMISSDRRRRRRNACDA
jgi:hypothetical protein